MKRKVQSAVLLALFTLLSGCDDTAREGFNSAVDRTKRGDFTVVVLTGTSAVFHHGTTTQEWYLSITEEDVRRLSAAADEAKSQGFTIFVNDLRNRRNAEQGAAANP